MEKNNFQEMSNAELKLYMEKLENEYEFKKTQLINICEEMSKIENDYLNAKNEINIRKNLYI
jgi:hypothetical protein